MRRFLLSKIKLIKISSKSGETFLLKIEKLFGDTNTTIRKWDPTEVDLSDNTICALCRKVDCICKKYSCPCGRFAGDCDWPTGEQCPCKNCFELGVKCSCHKPLNKFPFLEDEEETLDDE